MNRRIKTYFFYILLGLLYPIVKVICYINSLVYLRGVIYGLIAGVSTISVGILALKEYDGADKQKMPRAGFAIMKTVLTLRRLLKKPERTLREMGIQKGQTVLDYGCGIGSFSIPAAKMVGDDGVVYALDIHPLAIKAVEKNQKERNR